MMRRKSLPILGMPVMLLLVEIIAVLLTIPLKEAGIAAFEDPHAVTNPLIFIVILLAFTLLLLVMIHYGFKRLIAIIIGLSIYFTFVYIFSAIVLWFSSDPLITLVTPFLFAGLSCLFLYWYPEWYVIDTLGILIAAGAASIFGISLDIIPVIILLVILAIYDAISVYKTGHMITLAEGVIETRAPILFVIPKRRDYSYIHDGIPSLDTGERGAYVMGMGDMIMPAILVVSANVFVSAGRIGFFNIPAIGAMIGSLAGLAVLLYFVNRGKPQAGLPPLNGGTIIGFLIAYAIVTFF